MIVKAFEERCTEVYGLGTRSPRYRARRAVRVMLGHHNHQAKRAS